MILRRIAEAFRRQDWFTVFVETMIVVLGVFLGLQVSNWNATRSGRAKEAFAIASLRSDFQALDFSVSHGVCFHRRALDGLQVVAEALNAGRLDSELEERFENGLRFGYLNSASKKASGVLNELLSSGSMGLLGDPALRAALIDYEGFRETAAGSRDEFRLVANNYTRSFTDRFDYDLKRDHFRSDQNSRLAFRYSAIGDYDFAAMLADREFREAVFELREVQRVFLQWEEASLRRVREIQRMLGDQPLDEVKCK
ncbi:MAG: hypothetical protein ABL957_01860 [Parvularculaceae bacterium]